MSDLPATVFSPTETSAWDRCPVYWKTSYLDKWSPRAADYAMLTRWLGQAFAKGMARYLLHGAEKAELAAIENWNTTRTQWLAAGGTILAAGLERVGDVEAGLTRIIHQTIKEDVLADPNWSVIAVEQPLLRTHTTPDAIYQHRNGTRLIRDWKTSWSLESRWRARSFHRYLHSDQLKQYCVFGEANQILITLTSATPLWSQSQTLAYTASELDCWLVKQAAKWDMMQQHLNGSIPLWASNNHETPYGPCMFQDWCFNHGSDPRILAHLDFLQEVRGTV